MLAQHRTSWILVVVSLAVVFSSAIAISPSQAGTARTWTGAGDRFSWLDKDNWSPTGFPAVDDDLTISMTGPADNVSVLVDGGSITIDAGTATLGSLDLGEGSGVVSTLSVTRGGEIRLQGDSNSTLLTVGGESFVGGGFVSTAGMIQLDRGGQLLNEGRAEIGNAPEEMGVATISGTGTTWENLGELRVGVEGPGELTISGGATVSSGPARLTTNLGDSVQAMVIVSDPRTTWSIDGSAYIGATQLATLSIEGGATVQSGSAYIGSYMHDNSTANVTIDNATWTINGIASHERGLVRVVNGARLDVSSTYIVGDGHLEIDGGTLDALRLLTTGAGRVSLLGASTLRIQDASMPFLVGRDGPLGNVIVLNNQRLELAGPVHIDSDGILSGVDSTKFTAASILNHGKIVLSGDTVLSSYRGNGQLIVGSYEATLTGAGFVPLGASTTLSGGRILSATGVTIDGGDVLEGHGQVEAAMAAGIGSMIVATGDLTLGDPNAFDGFFSDGRLFVGSHRVTIDDENEAVLGSVTSLGSASAPGVIDVARGVVVESGKNVIGYGTLDTPNDATTPLINNGSVAGNAPTEPITLTGYVQGVGTFDHVIFSGTFAPGFSPAKLPVGSASYEGTLEMEIGGTTPGSEHDQLNHVRGEGVAVLDGILDLNTIAGYADPELRGSVDEVILVTASTIDGTFNSVIYDGTELMPTFEHDGSFRSYIGVNQNGQDGLFRLITYTPHEVLLTNYLALPGDANGDLVVDTADFDIWNAHNFTSGTDWMTGDFNGDHVTDVTDFNLWNDSRGQVAVSRAIPEPHGLTLWLVAVVLLLVTNRNTVANPV